MAVIKDIWKEKQIALMYFNISLISYLKWK